MISAKIIADSISAAGDRLTTMEVVMHRFVLAEFNTHRAFSRNSASSRAIPIEKRIREAIENPAMPLEWGCNKPGMQAGEKLSPSDALVCQQVWLRAGYQAVKAARALWDMGLHKQVANRLLEPFLWHTAVVSSTEWQNFFDQRCSPLAQPEIRAVAEAMRAALSESTPESVLLKDWHLPYIDRAELWEYPVFQLKKISAARCARVSYLTHEGTRDVAKDLELYARLVTAKPAHASPLEHVARQSTNSTKGNFRGWYQMRHEVLG